jgi:hypothetical protein
MCKLLVLTGLIDRELIAMTRKKGGRPKKAEASRLTKVVAVRMSAPIHAKVTHAARRAGLRPGVLVRKLVEDGQVVVRSVPEANMNAVGALAKIGTNLNQLLRLVQQGVVGLPASDLAEVIDELRTTRRALLGMDRKTPTGPVARTRPWKTVPLVGDNGEQD